jgi:hypothetical protein
VKYRKDVAFSKRGPSPEYFLYRVFLNFMKVCSWEISIAMEANKMLFLLQNHSTSSAGVRIK